MWILYAYVTSSGDIHYKTWSYAFVVQQKSRTRWQISAPSARGCVCARCVCFRWSRTHTAVVKSLKPLKMVRFTLQKQTGCFNHRVVTLVADKLKKQ